MALDPFFQQGMNNWSRSIADRRKQAASLTQLAQTGQVKDLLQQLAHKQKLAETDRSGQWTLADTALGKNLMTKTAAGEFGPGTQATRNMANIQRGARIADSAQKMGGFPGFAQQIGQYLRNPEAILGETGASPLFKKGIPQAQLSATAANPATGKEKVVVKRNRINGIPGTMSTETTTKEATTKGRDPSQIAKSVKDILTELQAKGDVLSYVEGRSRKNPNEKIWRVTYKDGTRQDLNEKGQVIKK